MKVEHNMQTLWQNLENDLIEKSRLRIRKIFVL